jgi:hypothetical protein
MRDGWACIPVCWCRLSRLDLKILALILTVIIRRRGVSHHDHPTMPEFTGSAGKRRRVGGLGRRPPLCGLTRFHQTISDTLASGSGMTRRVHVVMRGPSSHTVARPR